MHFKFKEFTVKQERSAMKVGTDGVLLGAWTSLKTSPNNILDIGTGTGLIALQLAQRSDAELIDGLEIDADAYEEAVENFENSPWSDRLFCYHASLQDFANEIEEQYDLIVSNPPFYQETSFSTDQQRKKARSTSSLSFKELIYGVTKLLHPKGTFTTIIPYKEETDFIELAKGYNLFVNQITRVKGTPQTEIKRSLLAFSFEENNPKINELIIELDRHQYTQDYIELVKDFYLKM